MLKKSELKRTGRPLHLILYASLFFLVFSLCCFKLTDPDLGLHLAVRRSIALDGRIPAINEFLYTTKDFKPLPDDKWLFRLVTYGFMRAGGPAGLIAWRLLLAVWIVVAMLWGPGRKTSPLTRAFMGGLFLLVISGRLTIRPELMSIALSASFIAILEQWHRQPKKLVPTLAGLQLLWVNSHGFFFFGLVLIGIWWVDAFFSARKEGKRNGKSRKVEKTLRIALAVCLIVCFLNPGGWRGVAYPVSVMSLLSQEGGVLRETIRELQPTWTRIRIFPPTVGYVVLVGVTGLAFLFTAKKRAVREWLLLAFGLVLSLQFIRNMPMIGLGVLPLGTSVVSEASRRLTSRLRGARGLDDRPPLVMLTVLLFLFSFLLLTDRYYRSTRMFKTTGIGWSDLTIPKEIANFVTDQKLNGPIFNTFNVGSSLAWFLYPREQAFINGDTSGYPVGLFASVVRNPPGATGIQDTFSRFRKWEQKYQFRLAVVSYRSPLSRSYMQYLFRSPNWFSVYLEPAAICFAHRKGIPIHRQRELERGTRSRLDDFTGSPIPKSSIWRVYRASKEMDLMKVCVAAGWMNQVQGLAHRVLEVEPNLPERDKLEKALRTRQ